MLALRFERIRGVVFSERDYRRGVVSYARPACEYFDSDCGQDVGMVAVGGFRGNRLMYGFSTVLLRVCLSVGDCD